MKESTGEIIEQGQINVQPDFIYPYIIRVLDKSDLMAVMQLQIHVTADIKREELYVPISEEEMRYILTGNGEALGVFIQDRMYAACALLFNVDDDMNMARELNFSNDELEQVAQLELSLVDPVLRGAKLQHKMAEALARREEARQTRKYLFSTSSPYNYASIQTLTALGLQIVRLCKMYYDWDRYVMYKEFAEPTQLDTANSVSIPNTAFAEQQQWLDKGYRGYSLFQDNEGIKIVFAPKL